MDDEPEVLDWGNEEDEQHMFSEAHRGHKIEGADFRRVDVEDVEDAVSLGGEDEDDLQGYGYQPHSQDDMPKSSFPSVKSTNPHSTQNSRDQHPSPTKSAQSQPQGSPRGLQRSLSTSKITHALPPKPVVAAVPYVHPSHPSITEATAMSTKRPDREKRANGVTPVSASNTEGGNPLPPDWELRYPRGGGRNPYYYNTKTHECTWTLPGSDVQSSSAKDIDDEKIQTPESRSTGKDTMTNTENEPAATPRPARRETESKGSSDVLSYEDRHYRPELRGGDSYRPRRDEEPGDNSYRPEPVNSPALPKTDRGRASLQQTQDDDRRHSRRELDPRVSSSNPDAQRGGNDARDRRDPPQNSAEKSLPLRSPSPARQRADMDRVSGPAREELRNDTIKSSPPRRRSPSPQLRIQPSTPQVSPVEAMTPASAASTTRTKTRFDRPASAAHRTRGHDIYIPAGSPRQRDQPPELASVQIDGNVTMRNRQDDSLSDRFSNRTPAHADTLRRGQPPPERPSSPVPISDEMQVAQSRTRKRQPLPPQSAHFRESEMSRWNAEQMPGPMPLPGLGDDSHAAQRSTNVHVSLPGTPRFPPQHSAARDSNHPEPARASLMQPPGPSLSSVSRPRRPEHMDAPLESPLLRDRDAMDVDDISASRASHRMNDPSGMYLDHEQGSGDVPKGPRAMAPKLSAPTSHPLPQRVTRPVSPPSHLDRDLPVQEYPADRFRHRSPPPRPVSHDRREPFSELPDRRHVRNALTREDPSWRPDPQRGEDFARQKIIHETDRNQARREPPINQSRRTADFSRPPPPTVSASNTVPIGIRRSHRSAENLQSEPMTYSASNHPPPPSSGRSVEPPRSRASVGYPETRDVFGSSPQYGNKVVPSMDSYRPASADGLMGGQRRRSAAEIPTDNYERGPSHPVEAFQSNSASGRPRGDSYYINADSQLHAREQGGHASLRSWPHRQPSPPPHSASRDAVHRPVTPPRHDSSLVSPGWQSTYGSVDRLPARPPDSTHQQNRGDGNLRRSGVDLDSHYRRPQDVASAHVTREPIVERAGGGSARLESRLGERFEERYAEASYRPHPLPPNPTLRRDDKSYINGPGPLRQTRSDDRLRPLSPEYSNTEWRDSSRQRGDALPTDRNRPFDNSKPDSFEDKPPRRRFGPRREELTHVDVIIAGDVRVAERRRDDRESGSLSPSQERPILSRRGGSLLDRLSLDVVDAGSAHMTSLRERVQVPTKRDREEMMSGAGDLAAMDASYDFDDGPIADPLRRSRRRTGRPRRGRPRNGG